MSSGFPAQICIRSAAQQRAYRLCIGPPDTVRMTASTVTKDAMSGSTDVLMGGLASKITCVRSQARKSSRKGAEQRAIASAATSLLRASRFSRSISVPRVCKELESKDSNCCFGQLCILSWGHRAVNRNCLVNTGRADCFAPREIQRQGRQPMIARSSEPFGFLWHLLRKLKL